MWRGPAALPKCLKMNELRTMRSPRLHAMRQEKRSEKKSPTHKKDLADIGFLRYSLGMDITATAAPDIKDTFTAAALDTTVKTTDKYEDKYFAKVEFTCDYGYGQVKTYAVGDEVGGIATKQGMAQYGCDGAFVERVIPWEKITVKTFCTVREYKTTVWEVTKK